MRTPEVDCFRPCEYIWVHMSIIESQFHDAFVQHQFQQTPPPNLHIQSNISYQTFDKPSHPYHPISQSNTFAKILRIPVTTTFLYPRIPTWQKPPYKNHLATNPTRLHQSKERGSVQSRACCWRNLGMLQIALTMTFPLQRPGKLNLRGPGENPTICHPVYSQEITRTIKHWGGFSLGSHDEFQVFFWKTETICSIFQVGGNFLRWECVEQKSLNSHLVGGFNPCEKY